jgi:1-deoxyxylulose-5-phosphate synthase
MGDELSANGDMTYKKIGSSGLKVSPICIGTAFRGFWNGQHDEATCIDVIERAIDLGFNFFDCANSYSEGRSEKVLGKALKGLGSKRDDLVLTSKVWTPIGPGANDRGLSRFHIMREIDRSLKSLQQDHLDIYLLHNFDPDTEMEETFRAMDDLVRCGKIRYVGICNYTAAQVVEALWTCDSLGLQAPLMLQNQYSLLHRWELEAELLPRCRQHGLGMMTYSALAIGLLSGAFRRGQTPPPGTLWASREARFDTIMTERVDRIVEGVIHAAQKLEKTPSQVAIAWVTSHPEVTSAMIGPDLPEHVEDAYGALGWELPCEIGSDLDRLSQPDLPTRYDRP